MCVLHISLNENEWTMLKCALTVFPVFVFCQIVCGELSSLELSVINLALVMSLVMNWTILPIVVVLPLVLRSGGDILCKCLISLFQAFLSY